MQENIGLGEPSPEARKWLRFFWVSIVVAHVVVFAVGFSHVGLKDHDQMLVFHEIRNWNQQYFSLDKQWTPVMCGGISAAGDPQIPVLSPAALLGDHIGPFWGMRILSILWFVIGFVAAFLYSGLWLRNREVRFLAAALFVGNGFFVCRFAYGHITFLPFLAFPLLLWALHRAGPWARAAEGPRRLLRRLFAALALGALLAIQVDGSGQALAYMLPWIGVYAFGLAVARRSVAPVGLFLFAVAIAGVLDAAFLWPLIDSQQINMRLKPGAFTNPLSFFIHLLAPFRGNFEPMPSLQNGYELSVFIGFILGWAIIRYGRGLLASMPSEVRWPLLFTTLFAFVLGMGSLTSVGVPKFLSPYDVMHDLPGFRSVFVTGRYWGFLALPLSLIGAGAFWKLIVAQHNPKMLTTIMLTAIGLQLGFQAGTIAPKLLKSRTYETVATTGMFAGDAEQVSYVKRGLREYQGTLITPIKGVINCYDPIDFIRPEMTEGDTFVSQSRVGDELLEQRAATGRFRTWSRIVLTPTEAWPTSDGVAPDTPIRLVLNQAWHPYWRTDVGTIEKHPKGNLVAVLKRGDLDDKPVELVFHDRVSTLGTKVSLIAWPIALGLLLLLAVLTRGKRARLKP